MQESFLDEGFILDKKIGVGQPKRIENAKILVANTAMDTDKIKIYGARVRVDSMQKVADIEMAERDKMRGKVSRAHLPSLTYVCTAVLKPQYRRVKRVPPPSLPPPPFPLVLL